MCSYKRVVHFSYPFMDLKTTYKSDYRIPELSPPFRYHSWDRKPVAPNYTKRKPYRPKDTQTLEYWDHPEKMPLLLHTEPTPIIRTVPNFKFDIIPKSQDNLKAEVIKTRPRQVMTPAISIDDITDTEMRELICTDMYTTTSMKSAQELDLKFTNRQIPNTTFQITVPEVQRSFPMHKRIQPELKKIGKYWEPKQYTSLVNPTKHFWSHYKETPVPNVISVEERKEVEELIDKNELRSGYDLQMAGYGGHVPLFVIGPFRKQDLANKC